MKRVLLVTGGVVVVAAVSITAGLVWGARGPAAEASPSDAFAAAPACADVTAEVIEPAVPSAQPEVVAAGPLENAAAGACAWTSFGDASAPPRSLHVEFEARFSRRDGQESGEQAAARRLVELAPAGETEGAAPVASLGEGAVVRPGTAEGGAAEVVFRRDNLLVRVWYGGGRGTDGTPLSYAQARDGAIGVAERLADSL